MKLDLKQGAYQARSPIANAQTCINLYPEPNPPDAPFPMTHYPAPGLIVLENFSGSGNRVRGLYVASTGAVFAVVGQTMLNLSTGVVLGGLPTNPGTPVSMCDNGTTLVVVDGTSFGGTVPLAAAVAGSLTPITDSAFYGSTRVDFIDTFLVFNQPGTGNFYTTTSNVVTPFDPLYFAAKEGWNDLLVCACCLHDNIWLLGEATTEIWYNAGGATFPFARMPNSILQQGCVAPYSAVIADNAIYWLSQDRWGRNMCMRGEGYTAKRISTFAIEDIWSIYPTLGDAVGMVFQVGGHQFIGFYFETANAYWVYDASTQLWHQRTYGDFSTPWLPYCTAFGRAIPPSATNAAVYAGGRNNGIVYEITRQAGDDAGTRIPRQRAWAHVQQDGNRLYHSRFAANMTGAGILPDTVTLDWSDDGGQSYGQPVNQTVNNQTNGQYLWRRLGYARDRVYRMTWSGAGDFALNGAYIDVGPGAT